MCWFHFYFVNKQIWNSKTKKKFPRCRCRDQIKDSEITVRVLKKLFITNQGCSQSRKLPKLHLTSRSETHTGYMGKETCSDNCVLFLHSSFYINLYLSITMLAICPCPFWVWGNKTENLVSSTRPWRSEMVKVALEPGSCLSRAKL